jgi:hypothetical protein
MWGNFVFFFISVLLKMLQDCSFSGYSTYCAVIKIDLIWHTMVYYKQQIYFSAHNAWFRGIIRDRVATFRYNCCIIYILPVGRNLTKKNLALRNTSFPYHFYMMLKQRKIYFYRRSNISSDSRWDGSYFTHLSVQCFWGERMARIVQMCIFNKKSLNLVRM